MERDSEVTLYNGPQRHPWEGAIYLHYFHPALENNKNFAQAIKSIFLLDKTLHCVRQALTLDCEKEKARIWLSKNALGSSIFDIYQKPFNDHAAKINNLRGFFPEALVVFVSPFPEHMDVGADIHIGIADNSINFGNKNKNFVKRVELTDRADICLNNYMDLANLAKYRLLVSSRKERLSIIRDTMQKRQAKLLKDQTQGD